MYPSDSRYLADIASVRGNFPEDNLFTKTKRSTLLNLTCVKADPGDLESWVFRELNQTQFGGIETLLHLR